MSDQDRDILIAAATAARDKAYAPYSKFQVGAALRDETGAIHIGVNVENAAYPVGQCAEASAIGAMITAGAGKITEVAVVGGGDALCTPCGACRQRLREFAAPTVEIHIGGPEGHRRTFALSDLLPASFGPENLD